MYRVWCSTNTLAKYVIANTKLSTLGPKIERLYESDASKPSQFHAMPDHIKQILYLDSPDIIVERGSDPIFSLEVSTEAGTGHNAFQRFARLAASVENDVPAFYVYPEAVVVHRRNSPSRWDRINPLIFQAMESMMAIYDIPALLFYFPSRFRADPTLSQPSTKDNKGLMFDKTFRSCPDSGDHEMRQLFSAMDATIDSIESRGLVDGRRALNRSIPFRHRRTWMQSEASSRRSPHPASPLSATVTVPTAHLLGFLRSYHGPKYKVGELLTSRPETTFYKVNAAFRGDPYPGALAAIDYLACREGRTFEDRRTNLVLVWGQLRLIDSPPSLEILGRKGRIRDFLDTVRKSESGNLLRTSHFSKLRPSQIPRYYMQCRYGSTFTKAKHIRVFSYFADAILFTDGALWRDG